MCWPIYAPPLTAGVKVDRVQRVWSEVLHQQGLVATDVPEEEVPKAVTRRQHVTLTGRGVVRVSLSSVEGGPPTAYLECGRGTVAGVGVAKVGLHTQSLQVSSQYTHSGSEAHPPPPVEPRDSQLWHPTETHSCQPSKC